MGLYGALLATSIVAMADDSPPVFVLVSFVVNAIVLSGIAFWIHVPVFEERRSAPEITDRVKLKGAYFTIVYALLVFSQAVLVKGGPVLAAIGDAHLVFTGFEMAYLGFICYLYYQPLDPRHIVSPSVLHNVQKLGLYVEAWWRLTRLGILVISVVSAGLVVTTVVQQAPVSLTDLVIRIFLSFPAGLLIMYYLSRKQKTIVRLIAAAR